MLFEVEQKHRILDLKALTLELEERGISIGPPELQVDTYFNHPVRDFAQTDEALRIRQEGDANFVTYKGPKLDTSTKTRRELELSVARGSQSAKDFAKLLGALGFERVAEVRKKRRTFTLSGNDRDVTVTLDEVDDLGDFLELEITATEAELEVARRTVAKLAEDLKLGPSLRESYLEMLLSKREPTIDKHA